jgi:hypothetical protein
VSRSRKQDAWVQAWADRYPTPQAKKRRGIRGRWGRGPWLLASASAIAALLAPAFAIAQGGGGQTFSSAQRYTLLVRNSGNGQGGATAQTCNTSPGNQACENNVNSGTGLAATYRTRGNLAVQFQTSGSGQATPFSISDNATGMVQNLNANMVGGLTAQQLFSGYQQVQATSSSTSKGVGGTQQQTVSCPTGTNLISQSGSVNQTGSGGNGNAVLQAVSPVNSTQAVVTGVVTGPSNANSNATFTVTAFAVCAQI